MRTLITFKEALRDAIDFYGADTSRRSRIGGDCFYLQDDGHRCAVGRVIKDGNEDFFHQFDTDNVNNSSIESVIHAYQKSEHIKGRELTEDEAARELTIVKDATLQDLNFLQILHDEDQNWNKDGLSHFGRRTIREFRPDIADEVLNTNPQANEHVREYR